MSRRSRQEAAERAASQASEAGRVLQAQRNEPEVEPQSDAERPPSRNEPRRLAMEEIEKRDMGSKGLSEPEPKPEPVADPVPPTPEKMLEGGKFSAPEPEPTPEPTPETAPATVRVKVDGEEWDVPQAEVEEHGGVKAYQIIRAADNRLKKANETVAKTQQTHAALMQWIQSQQQQPQSTPQQFLASKIDVIRYGSPEESAAALQEVLEKSNPRIDQNAVTQQAVDDIHRLGAVEKFAEEFQDIASNPGLMRFAIALKDDKLAQMRQTGDRPNWPTFFRQIGNEVRSVVGRQSQPSTTVPTTGTPSQVSSDKEARKASIVNLPSASARAELPKESKPETREDTLAQMRKSRGIPTG